ncbi:unnamed protein product [Effrenium voratum]|nr:unnamed protein product [Effrenium voratum]
MFSRSNRPAPLASIAMALRPLGALAMLVMCKGKEGNSSMSNLSFLHGEIQEELQRIMIAEFAAENAALNASEQARLLNESEHLHTECGPRYTAAKAWTTKAQHDVTVLEAKLNTTRLQLNETLARRRSLNTLQQHEQAIADEAEAEAQEARGKADAILPQRDAWVVSGMVIFSDWLSRLPCQNLVAASAGALGLASLLDSERFLQISSIAFMALGVGIAAGAKFLNSWSGEPLLLSLLVGSEAAFLAAAAAVVGLEGFQLFIGAIIGLVIAQLFAWVVGPAEVAFWYLAFLALGVAATGVGDKTAIAALGFAVGGFFLSSALVFVLAEILSAAALPSSWVDSADAYVNGINTQQALGKAAVVTRAAGFCLWAAVVVLGKRCSSWMNQKLQLQQPDNLRQPLLEVQAEVEP